MKPEETEEMELPEPDKLANEDIGEMLMAAYAARKSGFPRVQVDPAHVEALCLEVLRTRAAGKARS